ncbi:hypothetical protein Godav_013127 [Gossypium davidsonii]|uniref:RNase H type-1 domain-containing protein n=1 Tax=Gossypium davidsonii TaxID=34287 RepID=A0A7J8RFJ3_GOSDV|nr:hypothetical protein [Gossypium davidsonii]
MMAPVVYVVIILKIFCMLPETVQVIPDASKDVSRRNEQISVAQVLESWISLCTDRAVQIVSGNATARGVIRNGNEEWIMGYNRYLGKCSVFDAELWGILDGLALIQYRRYDGVMIQTDSLEVVKAIQDTKILFLILLIQ